jgi:hypothetical protein
MLVKQDLHDCDHNLARALAAGLQAEMDGLEGAQKVMPFADARLSEWTFH